MNKILDWVMIFICLCCAVGLAFLLGMESESKLISKNLEKQEEEQRLFALESGVEKLKAKGAAAN